VWRHKKVQFLKDQGFELCNHTLWHAQLSKYSDAVVQEQIARGEMAIDSAVPGYNVRTFALPLGVWPKNRALAKSGSWTDPKTGKAIRYDNDAILEVSGGPTESPYDPKFNPLSIKRIEVFGTQLENVLDRLDKNASRYVSDGDPSTVAKPAAK
jgi:peptidoglycan/xylan/chitin deacetylase (PgdA/CDA1 family)